MALAKDVSGTTLDFLLSQTGSLARRDAVLACVAATAADGHKKQLREILLHALKGGVSPALLREVLLEVAALAGLPRGEEALAALAESLAEADVPTDPFAALLEPRERREQRPEAALPTEDPEPASDAARASAELEAVHGERAATLRARLARRSKALARWAEEDLYGRVFGRPGLTRAQRVLVAVGALFPLDARASLEDFVHAARRLGSSPEALYALADTLARLFKEGPETREALLAFTIVLGRRSRPDEGVLPRWD
jgi:alkylhydroperoxidase/carboxymuconolactone decarboxylase family protein YurZ